MSYRVILVCAVLASCCSLLCAAAVTGTVLGTDGKPVAGAQVAFWAYHTGKTTLLVTNGAGVFTLDLDTARKGQGEGLGTICAFAPGLAIGGNTLFNKTVFVLTLTPACTLHGTVVDVQGKPLAGAPVRIESVSDIGQHNTIRIPDECAKSFSATTDASGQWAIAGIPALCRVSVRLDDARFARSGTAAEISPDAPSVVTLTARPGVALSGRLLAPDGKPADGMKVTLYPSAPYGEGTLGKGDTDTHGAYHLDGLLPGSYHLYAYDPQQRWLSPSSAVTINEQAANTAPDITLHAGALLSGYVVDDATGEKLPDVNVTFRNKANSGNFGVYTTADGLYKFRSEPGSYYVHVMSPPAGYVNSPEIAVAVGEGETHTVDIRLKKGLTLSGTIVDELGNPAPGAVASLTVFADKDSTIFSPNNSWFTLSADQDGHFTVSGLPAGRAQIGQGGSNDLPVWEIVKLLPLDLPTTEPVTVIVRKLVTQPLFGRVVSAQGTPCAGVKITIHAQVVIHSSGSDVQRELFTDADGRYSLPAVPTVAEITVKSVEKSGYTLLSIGAVTNANGQFTIADSILASSNATLSGHVVDAAGKAVAGALVASTDAGLPGRVTTDAAGAFTLKGLPEGDAHLLAVTADGCALWQGKTSETTLQLTLRPSKPPPPHDLPYLADLLAADDRLPKDQQRFDHEAVVETMATQDGAFAATVARREWPEALPDGVRSALLVALAHTDPTQAAAVGGEQLDRIYDTKAKFTAAIALGLAVAKTHPELAAHCYALAKAQDLPQGPNARTAQRAQLLQLATALGNGDRDALTAAIIAEANRAGKDTRGSLAYTAARYVPEVAETIWAGMDPHERIGEMESAIPVIALTDVKKARQLLATVQEDYSKNEFYGMGPNAIVAVIRALGKTDPAAALALARQQNYRFSPQQALVAAAAFQPREAALALYREAAALRAVDGIHQALDTASIAASAYRLDPQTGRALLAPALKYIMSGQHDENEQRMGADQRLDMLSRFAAYAGPIAPRETRLLLEIAYRQGLQQTIQQNWALQSIPTAMAILDLPRAWEITDALYSKPADLEIKRYIQERIIRYIAASDEERLTTELFGDY